MSWAKNSVGERGDNIGLPDVTTADNGKIMEVEGGEWKLKEGSGGGGGIPAPENPSDGDVLTYDSTAEEWVAAAPGGGSGGDVFLINITRTETALVTDKTAGEIKAALEAGKILFTVLDTSEGADINIIYSLVSTYLVDQGVYVIISSDNEYDAASLDDYMECPTN